MTGKFITTNVSYVVVHVLLIYFINLFFKKNMWEELLKLRDLGFELFGSINWKLLEFKGSKSGILIAVWFVFWDSWN
jgi:hypothetical protein